MKEGLFLFNSALEDQKKEHRALARGGWPSWPLLDVGFPYRSTAGGELCFFACVLGSLLRGVLPFCVGTGCFILLYNVVGQGLRSRKNMKDEHVLSGL